MDTYHYVLYIHLLSLLVGIGAAAVLVVCLFQLRGARELTDALPWGRVAGKTGRVALGLLAPAPAGAAVGACRSRPRAKGASIRPSGLGRRALGSLRERRYGRPLAEPAVPGAQDECLGACGDGCLHVDAGPDE